MQCYYSLILYYMTGKGLDIYILLCQPASVVGGPIRTAEQPHPKRCVVLHFQTVYSKGWLLRSRFGIRVQKYIQPTAVWALCAIFHQ